MYDKYKAEELTMSIKYLCSGCCVLLKMSGFDAVNEVGRKYCEGCGGNDDDLTVVDADECDEAIKRWNIEHPSV